MSGGNTQGTKSVLKENMMAVNPHRQFQREANQKPQMCWKCQKDKPVRGGEITMIGGMVKGALRKFNCKECVEERLNKPKVNNP